jgi:phosphoglycolate phosphatase-like HAD superfamily hydrolase
MTPSKLVLFDIDGTLLTTVKKAWMFPFADAIREVLRVPVDPTGFHAGGKTDPQIILEMTAPFGLPVDEVWAAIPAIRGSYLARLREVVRGPEDAALKPGVRALVEELSGRQEAALGLLTGNFEEGARVKLAAHGLNAYFPFGAFGDGARKRVELAARVEPLARERFGRAFPGHDTVLVGDTFYDIDCARAIGARIVAVATGPFPAGKLAEGKPDFLFEDLSDTAKAVRAILD